MIRILSGLLARRISYRILSGYAAMLGMMLLVLLLAITRLAAYSDSVDQSFTQASPHIQLGSTVAQQIAAVRLRVAKYLRTQAPDDYNEATSALAQLGASIEDALVGLSDPAQVEPLRRVQDSYVTYVNTFRNLVAVISKREQEYTNLMRLQTAIETRLNQLMQVRLTDSPLDVDEIEAGNQVLAHVQLASNEMTILRLQPRPDSMIWLSSELLQIQLWFNVLSDHSGGLSGEGRELYHQIADLHTQFQDETGTFMLLHDHDEQQARDSLEQVGTQLEQSSNIVLDEMLKALNSTVLSLKTDATASQRALFFMLVVAAIISIPASLALTIGLTHPLRHLSRTAQAIAGGDLGLRARMTRQDEIGQLAVAFDQMTDSLQRSLETERAANEQIRRQTLQIARQTQASAVMEERQRIARELHDSVKQQLFSISLSAGAALNLLSGDPEAARNYLEHLRQASREAQIEMKNLLQEMLPAPLQEHRLEEALAQYLGSLSTVHHLQIVWQATGNNNLSPTYEHALFRAAQEAIANVIRHSGAHSLAVTLRFGTPTLLVVQDDGCGFNPDTISGESTGLATMRARLGRVGGEVEVHSAPGQGTRIQMTVNLEIAEVEEMV